MTLCIKIVKHYRHVIKKCGVSMMGEHSERVAYQNDCIVDHRCPEHHYFKSFLGTELGISLLGAAAHAQPFKIGLNKCSPLLCRDSVVILSYESDILPRREIGDERIIQRYRCISGKIRRECGNAAFQRRGIIEES